jgi:hypothetical protein
MTPDMDKRGLRLYRSVDFLKSYRACPTMSFPVDPRTNDKVGQEPPGKFFPITVLQHNKLSLK